ncbi:hypothetical protein RF11_15881 [Thelohanellus kitauei]|uniref:Uncharacterized protein n=1 Tax=Thelohanellus kitauei TaxID=669202 RepID=A0A0C2N1R2_THEKT|nr:hypothetical protein RF11_15881 [Thelohanellus kitauei]
MKNFELFYVFWEGAPNYLVFCFQEKKDNTVINQIVKVSEDGGKSFVIWRLADAGKVVYFDQLIPIKDSLFGISSINRTFIYVNSKAEAFSVQRFEANSLIIPSHFLPSFIYKLVKKDASVS